MPRRWVRRWLRRLNRILEGTYFFVTIVFIYPTFFLLLHSVLFVTGLGME
jgi:hypothetical protein